MREFFLFFPNIVLLLQLIFRYLYDGTSQMVLYFDDSSTNLFRLGTDFICPNKMRYMIVSDTPQNTDPKTCQELSNCRDWAKSKPGSRNSSFFAKMNGYCACWTKISHQDFLRTYIVKWKTCAGWLFVCVRPSVRPSSRSVQFVVIWFIQWILLNRACWSIYIGFMSKPKRNLTRQYHNNKIICVGF